MTKLPGWYDGRDFDQRKDAATGSAKNKMIKIINEQPEDSSYDELLRELAFARMVERALADSDAGRTISDADMKHRIQTWRK